MRLRLAAAMLAAIAPAAGHAADPADPAAPVPRMEYRSVFQDTPAGVETATEDWKKANAAVGQFPRGHADLLKWEERQGANVAPAPAAPAAAPALPSAPPAGGHHH